LRAFDESAWPLFIGPLDAARAAIVAELHGRCFDRPWTAADFRRLLTAEHCRSFGAFNGEALAGFILISVAADEAEILTIAVDPPLRRQGIARALLDKALAEALRSGASAMLLEVGVGNEAAKALYASCSFLRVGRRRDYYVIPNGTEDALVMKRSISS
jgi:ribosomal-protein-alanine N-acetyltransferase